MPSKKELIRGAAVSLGFRVAGSVAGFGFNLLIARTLGMSEAGLFFLALSLLNVLSMFGRFGADVVSARYVAVAHSAKNYSSLRGAAALGLCVTILVSFILAVVTWISAPYASIVIFGDEQLVGYIRLAALAVIPIALQKIFSDMLLVTGNVWVSQFIQNFLPSAANCFFFWIAAKVIFLFDSMAAIAFAAASIALIAAVSWWSDSVRRQGSIDFPVIRNYLRSCAAAFGVTIAGLGITAVSPLILGMYADKEQVAIFTVASRLALIASLITLSVQNISMGKFAIAFSSNNNDLLRQHANQSAGLTLALCACFLVPCVIFSEELMRLFGESYVAGAPVLVILCIGQLVASIFGPVNAVLLMTGHERQVRNFSGLMMIMGIFLHFILVPKYGAIGAAIASSLAFVAAIFILAFVVRKRLGFWPTLNFLR